WFDERFIMHRLKSTRFATVVTAVVMGGYAEYEIFVHHIIRWDIVVFLGILVFSKLGAMIYYRLSN
ncbi:MAG: hypothetical protein KAH24_05315, partial [Holophagae bacterium]|nr:hypothetical protein [Holophagae bacterium]